MYSVKYRSRSGSRTRRSCDDLLLLQVGDNGADTLLDGLLVGVEVDLRVFWGLVRVVNAREVPDKSLPGLLVEALWVSLLGDGERHVDKDLDEREVSLLVELSGRVSVCPVWRDEGGQRDHARVGKELRHLRDPSDVLVSVLLAETQVLVQAETDVVTVESVALDAILQELLLKGARHRTLARGAQASEPQGGPILLDELFALVVSQVVVPGNVRCHFVYAAACMYVSRYVESFCAERAER